MAVTPDSCLAADGGDDRVCWPPGFRFHPTDEELVLYYLKRKICRRRLKLDIIRELDVYKWDPEELPGQSLLKTGDRLWFFFSPRDRKYPNGARSNRATRQGYWKATGKDRSVTCNSRDVGVKKTLVFYRGRAPTGARTDWVMHEYTMDEDELKRCNNVKDYYALYKVYKKSGPGPKNGEQYGAPFKEEDWCDDEHADLSNYVTPVEKQITAIPHLDNTRAVARVEQPLIDVDNFLKQPTFENPNGQTQIDGYANGLPQVAVDEVTQSTLLDPSCREVLVPEALDLSSASSQQFGMQVSLDFNQSGTSTLQLPGAPEVKSIPNNSDPVSQFCEEDFLEMDDLLGPEPTFSKTDKLAENIGFDNFVGLSELDLYHDAALFFHEMGPVGQESTSHVYGTGFQLQHNAVTNQVNYQLQPHSGVEDVNYHLLLHSGVEDVNYQLQPHSGVEDVNYQLQPHSGVHDVNYLQPEAFGSDQLWVHDQRSNSVLTPTESIDGTLSHATSGVVNESSSNPTIANEIQTGGEDQDSAGWLSSALWSFVESIPTTPASAAENPLVNKAFERMSSFSRLRMNVKSYNNNDDDVSNAHNCPANARSAGRNRGFLFLSVFGALCAILWVLVGSVRVLQRTIS